MFELTINKKILISLYSKVFAETANILAIFILLCLEFVQSKHFVACSYAKLYEFINDMEYDWGQTLSICRLGTVNTRWSSNQVAILVGDGCDF